MGVRHVQEPGIGAVAVVELRAQVIAAEAERAVAVERHAVAVPIAQNPGPVSGAEHARVEPSEQTGRPRQPLGELVAEAGAGAQSYEPAIALTIPARDVEAGIVLERPA